VGCVWIGNGKCQCHRYGHEGSGSISINISKRISIGKWDACSIFVCINQRKRICHGISGEDSTSICGG
jgi:hypothetical protein